MPQLRAKTYNIDYQNNTISIHLSLRKRKWGIILHFYKKCGTANTPFYTKTQKKLNFFHKMFGGKKNIRTFAIANEKQRYKRLTNMLVP